MATTSYFSSDRFYLAAGSPQWGFWGDCIDSVNNLIEDLVRPSNEMQRVIDG